VPLPFVRVRKLQSDLGLVYGVQRHFQQYFSYIVAVRLIDGGNWCTRRKQRLPQVTDKLYFIILHRVYFAWVRFEPTTSVMIGTDGTGSCNSNYHSITTMTVPYCIMLIRTMDIRPNYSASVWHIYYLSLIDFFLIYLIFFPRETGRVHVSNEKICIQRVCSVKTQNLQVQSILLLYFVVQ